MKCMKIYYLSLIISISVFAQEYQDSELLNQRFLTRVMEGNHRSFQFAPTPPNPAFVKRLSDPELRKQMFEEELYRYKNLNNRAMCCQDKECFNPPMDKRKWMNVIDSTMQEFESTYSESVKQQPVLAKSFYDEIDVLKHDPKCVGGKNECLTKLSIVYRAYASMFTPDFPEVEKPKGFDKDPVKFGMSDYARAQDHKEKFDTYKEMVELLNNDESLKKEKDPWFAAYKKIMQKENPRRDDRWLSIYYPAFRGRLAEYQTILSYRAAASDSRVSRIINPRKGYNDPSHQECNLLDFVKRPESFGVSLYAALPGIIEDVPKPPCTEKINYIWEKNVDVTFGTGNEYLDKENQEKVHSAALKMFEEKKREGFTVTGYKILASASQPWGSLSPEEAKKKNLDLAQRRASNSQKIIDGISGFSELDHISDSKLSTKNALASLEEKPQISVQVSGPEKIAPNLKAKDKLTDENITSVYDSIKDDLSNVRGIKSLEEFKAFVADPKNKIRTVSEASFKPFQFFKIVIEGRKSEDKPCGAEVVLKEAAPQKKRGAVVKEQ